MKKKKKRLHEEGEEERKRTKKIAPICHTLCKLLIRTIFDTICINDCVMSFISNWNRESFSK